MKACIYARVSTAGQEENGSSLTTQVQACAAFAVENGCEVARVVEEVYSGAYLFERPLINSIRDQIKTGAYDVLIAYAIDRLSRDTAHLIILSDECDRYNVRLLFVTEDIDNSPEGKLMQSVKGYVAEVERLKIRERTLRGRTAKARQQQMSYAYKLFGYLWNPETRRREVVDSEATVVRRIFDELAGGNSLRQIALLLDRENVPTVTGTPLWPFSTIRKLAINPAFAGRTYAFKFKSVISKKRGRKIMNLPLRPQDEWILQADDLTPPIVSLELFEQVQGILAVNKKEKRRTALIEMLLRGRIACGICGQNYTTIHDSRNGRTAYRCNSVHKGYSCGNPQVSAKKIEAPVWAMLVEVLRNPDLIASQIKTARARKKPQDDGKLIERLIVKAEGELQRMVSRAAVASDEVWNLMQGQIAAKQKELEALRVRRVIKVRSDPRPIDARSVHAFCAKLGQKLDSLTFEQRSLIIRAFDARLLWSDGHAKLTLSVPKSGANGDMLTNMSQSALLSASCSGGICASADVPKFFMPAFHDK
jgi:site-specific DNA recombinase